MYKLNFNAAPPRADVRAVGDGLTELIARQPDEALRVLVLILTDDFQIHGDDMQVLYVPYVGVSGIVSFTIEPQHPGASYVTAVLSVNNRVFRKMHISFQVDTVVPTDTHSTIVSSGMHLDRPFIQYALPKQTVSLTIIRREVGYQLILQSGVVMRAVCRLWLMSDIAHYRL